MSTETAWRFRDNDMRETDWFGAGYAMTKNLGNARYMPPKDTKASFFSKAAPALFPLVVAALGYMIGRQFFGI
jgi:hypothetical protein